MTRALRPFAVLALALGVAACAGFQGGPVGNAAVPQPARAVELDRYLGRWHELYRYDAAFQKGCEAVTADYALRPDGMITVLNSCRMGSPAGRVKTATGKAKVVDTTTGAKLKVSFFGPFYGDYWVLDRAEDYSWSIVGEPSGRFLWVLHRQADPGPEVRAELRRRVEALGYDWGLVRTTRH